LSDGGKSGYKHCLEQFHGLEAKQMTTESTVSFLREHNEQQLRSYVAMINLQHSLNRVSLSPGEKIRVHFLYLSDAYWPAWASVRQACLDDARMDVKLIFLEREPGVLPDFPPPDRARKFLESNAIPYTPYRHYDPYAERPHLLIYQSPYNTVYLHFAKLKPNYVKQAGIRPVYISYGIEYDKPAREPHLAQAMLNMMHYRQYVQLFAWKIFVMHEDIREGFFRHCLAGGAHVTATGHPKFDGYAAGGDAPLPGHLRHKAAGRPILVWNVHHFWSDKHTSVAAPRRTHSLPFAKTHEIVDWLHNYSGLFTIVTFHPLFDCNAVKYGHAAPEEVENLKNSIRQSPNAALYEGEYQPLLESADAFITEKSSLMLEMAFLSKPVLLLQDLQVAFKPFATDIASSFYQGKDIEDVQRFVRIVEGSSPDTLAGERLRVRKTYFAGCDGHVGERIKEHMADFLLAELEDNKRKFRT
jgi:hypothetical protein